MIYAIYVIVGFKHETQKSPFESFKADSNIYFKALSNYKINI